MQRYDHLLDWQSKNAVQSTLKGDYIALTIVTPSLLSLLLVRMRIMHYLKDKLCTPCYPIIHQVFFAAGYDEGEEPHYLAFNFTDNVLKDIQEECERESDIDDALSECGYKVLLCR
jgi:hypothetical protein